MKRYYLIVQNDQTVEDIGLWESLIEAENYIYPDKDHYTHGEAFIIVSEDFFKTQKVKTLCSSN